MKATQCLLVGALVGVTILAGCGTSANKQAQGDTSNQRNFGAGTRQPPPDQGLPCSDYPSLGTPTPANLPLPTAGSANPPYESGYTTGSVVGPTSFFGGASGGGAPDPFTLTMQWATFPEAGLPNRQEYGGQPCNNTDGTGHYRSYYAAMRWSPSQNDPKKSLDYSAYKPFVPAADTVEGAKYHQWDRGPIWDVNAPGLPSALAYLYGRRLKVTRISNGKSVIVRAVDRGPNNEPPYGERPVDLSPWAMGALVSDPACLDFDGVGSPVQSRCDFTGHAADDKVRVEWADNSLPLGPVQQKTK